MTEENPVVEKEKEKECPLRRVLACENCRLFINYPNRADEKICVFICILKLMI